MHIQLMNRIMIFSLKSSVSNVENDLKSSFNPGIFIVAAKRTPFGTYGGKFVQKSAADLQEVAAKAALASGGIKPESIDHVIIGNVLGVSF